jgi:hypothetical protein
LLNKPDDDAKNDHGEDDDSYHYVDLLPVDFAVEITLDEFRVHGVLHGEDD